MHYNDQVIINLGENLFEFAPDVFQQLNQSFSIDHCPNGLQYLADPSCLQFVFCVSDDNTDLLQQALTICRHLSKRLIILYQHSKPKISRRPIAYLLSTASPRLYKQLLITLKLCNSGSNLCPRGNAQELTIEHLPRFIMQNLDKPLREDQLAEIIGYSPSYFSRLFFKSFGTHFGNYVLDARIDRAKQLLIQQKQQKVATIAVQCGFNDPSYFSKMFKRETGQSPATFRQQN